MVMYSHLLERLPMFLTLAVIGRNVGTVPMSYPDWYSFRSSTYMVFLSMQANLPGHKQLSEFEGLGDWGDMTESSMALHLVHEAEVPDVEVQAARERLNKLAAEFGQEAIAFTPNIDSQLVWAAS